MTTATSRLVRQPLARLFVLALAGLLALLALPAPQAGALNGVPLPTRGGTVWEVVAGYNTYTHVGGDPHALDIVRVDAETTGSEVRSPVDGRIRYNDGDCLTVSDENDIRHLLCHVIPAAGIDRGSQVSRGDLIARVAPAYQAGNNGLPHIHYALHRHWGGGLQTLPFTGEYRLEGRELPDYGIFLQYSGTRFTSSNGVAPAPSQLLPLERPEIVAAYEADPNYLVPGWNLVGWTGDPDLGDAVAGIADDIAALYTYDAATQRFRTWAPDLPVSLRSLSELSFGAGVWAFVENLGGVAWQRPSVELPRSVPLQRGFNLVTWTPGARDVVSAIESLGAAVSAVYVWDPLGQRFQVYRVDGPSFLNDLEIIQPGQAMWVDVVVDITWDQI